MLRDFFSKYKHAQQISMEENKYMDNGPTIIVCINNKHDEKSPEAKFVLDSILQTNICTIINLDQRTNIKRDNLEETCKGWIKWKAYDIEGRTTAS